MNPPRLAHERRPPTLTINNFSRFSPLVGSGALSPGKWKNAQSRAEEAQGSICATSGLYCVEYTALRMLKEEADGFILITSPVSITRQTRCYSSTRSHHV